MERDEFTYKILKAIQNGKKPHWDDFSMTQEQFEAEIESIEKDNLLQVGITNSGDTGNEETANPKLTSNGVRYIEEFEQE